MPFKQKCRAMPKYHKLIPAVCSDLPQPGKRRNAEVLLKVVNEAHSYAVSRIRWGRGDPAVRFNRP